MCFLYYADIIQGCWTKASIYQINIEIVYENIDFSCFLFFIGIVLHVSNSITIRYPTLLNNRENKVQAKKGKRDCRLFPISYYTSPTAAVVSTAVPGTWCTAAAAADSRVAVYRVSAGSPSSRHAHHTYVSFGCFSFSYWLWGDRDSSCRCRGPWTLLLSEERAIWTSGGGTFYFSVFSHIILYASCIWYIYTICVCVYSSHI